MSSLKAYGTEPNPGTRSGLPKGDGAKRDPFFLRPHLSVKQRGNLGLMHILAIGHICCAEAKLVSHSLKEEWGVTSRDALLATLCSFM